MKKNTVFDRIINELTLEDTGTEQLDQCMCFNYNLSRKVPLRYKIISIGFVRKYTLEKLNDKLRDYGLARLYARNLWEASLLFAFKNSLSYDEWKNIAEIVQKIKERSDPMVDVLGQRNISLNTIRKYIGANSNIDSNAEILTMHKTRHMESVLCDINASKDLIVYLQSNIREFSVAREKTRYYFCKYLWFYLECKIGSYLKIASKGINYRLEDIMDELSVFQGSSKVKRSAMSPDQVQKFLEDAPISCGVIYAEFNEFFFGYVSLDWMQVLIEQAGDLKKLPRKNLEKLAAAARQYDKKFAKMDDLAIIRTLDEELERYEAELDREASLTSENRGYQKNRVGENTVRKYLKGTLDLDRTTFICFLLFFASDLTKPARLLLDQVRLDSILKECGFRTLDPYNDFDYFIINYLTSKDPVDYLMMEVTRYALTRENFYLYKLYQGSRSDDADLHQLLKESLK